MSQHLDAVLSRPLLDRMRHLTSLPIERIDATATAVVSSDALAIIIDPGEFVRNKHDLLNALSTIDARRIIVYIAIGSKGLRGLTDLVRAGVRHVLIAGIDDSPECIQRVMDEVAGTNLAEGLLTKLATFLGRLPPALRGTIQEAVLRPDRLRTVSDVCRASRMPRRSCDRSCARAGLSSLRRLIQTARVVRVIPQLRANRMTLEVIARRTCVTSGKRLSLDVRAVLGVSPNKARSLSDEFILASSMAYVFLSSAPLQARHRGVDPAGKKRPKLAENDHYRDMRVIQFERSDGSSTMAEAKAGTSGGQLGSVAP